MIVFFWGFATGFIALAFGLLMFLLWAFKDSTRPVNKIDRDKEFREIYNKMKQ